MSSVNKEIMTMKKTSAILTIATTAFAMLLIEASRSGTGNTPAGEASANFPGNARAAVEPNTVGRTLSAGPGDPAHGAAVHATRVPAHLLAAVGRPAQRSDRAQPFRDEDGAEHSSGDKMSGQVAALAAAGGPGVAEVIVRYDQYPQLFDDERVTELGGTVTRSYETLEMRAIEIPVASLDALAQDDNVDWLSLDGAVSSLSIASRETANLPAPGSVNAAYSGLDVGIAVVDTGVSGHADLPANVLQYSFLNGSYPAPVIENGTIVDYADDAREDLFGHGTHVAGILSGSGVDSAGDFKGTATGAKLLALQVLDQDGGGSMSDVMASLDWLLTYGSHFDIRVVNLSLGMSIAESNSTDPLVLAVERLWDAGMVVVVAAGNSGFAGNMTINSPGNSRKVITVGSLTDSDTGTDFTDDYVSTFSSQGPSVGDLVLKPDLLAPGNRLVASIPQKSLLLQLLPDRAVGCTMNQCTSQYLELSGTSMATPMVAAAAALMLHKDPTLSPSTVKARLMRSARKIDAEPTAAGAGVLDADAALSETGMVSGQALSPLMSRDEATGNILIEDTSTLWGDQQWSAGYLFNGGFDWAEGYAASGSSTVSANGYLWTDGGVWATGYLWTDNGVWARGYLWTDGGVDANSFFEGSADGGAILNDDAPASL